MIEFEEDKRTNQQHRLTNIDPINMTATCSVCGEAHIYRLFKKGTIHKNGRGVPYARSYDSFICAERDKLRCRRRSRSHPESINGPFSVNNVLRKLGITPTMLEDTFNFQRGRCAICDKKLESKEKTRIEFNADHCHATGKLRGLLCKCCNTSLGKLGDNIEGLQKAMNYLESTPYSNLLASKSDTGDNVSP